MEHVEDGIDGGFHPDVDLVEPEAPEKLQVFHGLVVEIRDVREAADGLAFRKVETDAFPEFRQAVRAETERVSVDEEQPRHVRVLPAQFAEVFFHFLVRAHPERDRAVHRAEAAPVVAAAVRHLKERYIAFERGAKDRFRVMHRDLLFPFLV